MNKIAGIVLALALVVAANVAVITPAHAETGSTDIASLMETQRSKLSMPLLPSSERRVHRSWVLLSSPVAVMMTTMKTRMRMTMISMLMSRLMTMRSLSHLSMTAMTTKSKWTVPTRMTCSKKSLMSLMKTRLMIS